MDIVILNLGRKGRNEVGRTPARWSHWTPGSDGSPLCLSVSLAVWQSPNQSEGRGSGVTAPLVMCCRLGLGEGGITLFTKCLAIKLTSGDNSQNFILRLPK